MRPSATIVVLNVEGRTEKSSIIFKVLYSRNLIERKTTKILKSNFLPFAEMKTEVVVSGTNSKSLWDPLPISELLLLQPGRPGISGLWRGSHSFNSLNLFLDLGSWDWKLCPAQGQSRGTGNGPWKQQLGSRAFPLN